MSSLFTLDGFEDYVVETTETPTAFIVAASAYVGLCFCFIIPLVAYSRTYTKTSQETPAVDSNDYAAAIETSGLARPGEQELVTLGNDTQATSPHSSANSPMLNGSSKHTEVNGKIDGQGEEAIEEVSPEPLSHAAPTVVVSSSFPVPTEFSRPMDQVSAIHSAATTSRLRETIQATPAERKRTRRISMGWKHRRPIGRLEARERSTPGRSERHSQVSEDESMASRSRASCNSRTGSRTHTPRGVSDLANSVLEAESIEGEAEYYRQRYVQRSRGRRRSSTARSERSALPPLSPDALAPEDAADAFDPGASTGGFDDFYSEEIEECCWPFGAVYGCLGAILDLAEPDFVTKRILVLAFPSTISAISEPLFRLVLVAIISHFIDTDSMVAFILVILFVRITMEELSAAITDTETTMIENALMEGGDTGFFRVGQRVQLAVFMQLLVGVPLLALWAYVMEDMIFWLVDSEMIASIAFDYTRIIIIDYIVQATCRAFLLLFRLTVNERFESNFDLCATLLTLLTIAIIVGFDDTPTLVSIGWIQVAIGGAKALMKIGYVVAKGWVRPYRSGLLGGISLKDGEAVVGFLFVSFPLFIGSLVELREWELLTLCIKYLGAAEVASWALMGIVWEVFEASTEGLGDAASIRISFFLEEGLPAQAKNLSNKVFFLALVEALAVTSIFLMAGPNIAVSLTTDSTLENIFNDLVGITGLANVAMTFAQVYWSLVGAQGRYGLASSTIMLCRWLVTMPLALTFIFGLSYDLRAVAGSIAVGYATASSFLVYSVVTSDWQLLSLAAQEDEAEDESFLNFSESDQDDDSSDYGIQ